MANFSGFIRKSPSDRLRRFLKVRGVNVLDDFDWTSEGRGTALVRSIEGLLEDLPDRQQDNLKAEFELLASLSDDNGMTGAVQVCAGQGIDLEGLQGVQEVLLMLAAEHPRTIDRVNVQASLMRRHGGKQWARFQFPDDGKPWVLDQPSARDGFLKDTVEILELPGHRKREADWYQSIRVNPMTEEETKLTQATIYIEEHAQSELAFGEESLERQTVQKVMEVGVACDPNERIVEICAKGGKKLRDKYLQSFAANFAPQSNAPVEIPRRDVLLDTLRQAPEFETDPADGIQGVEVSSLSFRSSDGGFVRAEKRADNETLYQFLDRRFGRASPLCAPGWQILAATLRVILTATQGKSSRTLTVTLSAPNTTTLPNKTETDRQFVYDLLERWNLLAPPPTSADLFEVIE
ncbi:hypothetical protein [Falsiphaeobacter marinintestinus]|uniref:hypothetical protein n=1 Tax=Falsiphaeobacter marinintestinus TaxID=1492905 RepID=UPI0011B6FC45|nr:hypothetical protein [Phaeobacter marinintestinus]